MRETLDIEIMFSIPLDLVQGHFKNLSDSEMADTVLKDVQEEFGEEGVYIGLHRVSRGLMGEPSS